MENIIEAIRPKLMIGISTHVKVAPKEIENELISRVAGKGCACDVCGILINAESRFTIEYNNMWFNACNMCYYTQNIDQIPHFLKGEIVFYPNMSQERVYTLLRAVWSVEYFASIEDDNDELEETQSSLTELVESLSSLKDVTYSYFTTSNPDVISSMLNLLTDDEYEQRYKLFNSFRWVPDRRTFEDDIPRWAQDNFNHLHPEKMSCNITNFMSKYTPSFKIND